MPVLLCTSRTDGVFRKICGPRAVSFKYIRVLIIKQLSTLLCCWGIVWDMHDSFHHRTVEYAGIPFLYTCSQRNRTNLIFSTLLFPQSLSQRNITNLHFIVCISGQQQQQQPQYKLRHVTVYCTYTSTVSAL